MMMTHEAGIEMKETVAVREVAALLLPEDSLATTTTRSEYALRQQVCISWSSFWAKVGVFKRALWVVDAHGLMHGAILVTHTFPWNLRQNA
jgi:hypothetical protein